MKKLRNIFLPALALVLSCCCLKAQSVTTDEISFKIEDVSDLFMFPNLKVKMEFMDENRNKVLQSLEKAVLRLNITNEGGPADSVEISIVPERDYKGIRIMENNIICNVGKNSFVDIDIPFYAELDVATEKGVKYNINVKERYGYNVNSVLTFSTLEYQKASLKMNGVSIIDSGKGLQNNGNPDGMIQRGETVQATVTLQNIGIGKAENITYNIATTDPNIYLLTESIPSKSISGRLPDMSSATVQPLSFRLSVNSQYVHEREFLPVYLTVKEDKGFGDIITQNIEIPLDASPVEPEIVTVVANLDEILDGIRHVGPDIITIDPIQQSPSVRNIKKAPLGESIYSDAIAVVIGTENYEDPQMPQAPYARRDAEVMAEYFKNSMGIKDVTVLTDDQVKSTTLDRLFGEYGDLARKINPGKTEVFVYYSGHGTPKEDGSDVYLIPNDVYRSQIHKYGLSINKFYDNLASLDAKSVTVILDACFSGGSRSSDRYKSESISGQKLVTSVNMMNQPWLVNPNFRVFTSSKGDQASLGYDLSESGLFTYHLALGLQGDADKDGDGNIMMSEIVEYVTESVDKASGMKQTPQYYGNTNDDFVLVKIR